jgi:hypothetical protein
MERALTALALITGHLWARGESYYSIATIQLPSAAQPNSVVNFRSAVIDYLAFTVTTRGVTAASECLLIIMTTITC